MQHMTCSFRTSTQGRACCSGGVQDIKSMGHQAVSTMLTGTALQSSVSAHSPAPLLKQMFAGENAAGSGACGGSERQWSCTALLAST